MIPPSALASTDAGTTRFENLRLGIAAFGIAVIVAFAGSSAYDTSRSYDYALTANHREIGNMAHALAEQTAWSLQTVDLLLIDTARWYKSESQAIAPGEVEAAMAARAAAVKQVREVLIMDANGDTVLRSRASSGPTHNAADRSYFIVQKEDPNAGLYLSEPLTTRTEGRAAVILSRRLEDDAGHFTGVVIANVDLQELNDFYRAVDVGAGSGVQLMRSDGTLLVRIPRVADAVGRKFPSLLSQASGPTVRVANPVDGQTDFIAVAPVRNTSLNLAVTRDAAVALAPWRGETLRVAIRTLIVMLFGGLTLALLLRQIGRVTLGQRALRESEERYSLAMEGANEGHFDWDVTADRLFLSPRMKVLDGQAASGASASGTEWMNRVAMHAEDRLLFEKALREHFAGQSPRFEREFRVRHQEGDWHWLLARGRCLFDAAGKPSRFVGSAIDITVQKQAQLDKEQLESQLRQSQKMEAVGTLAGGIAHDFNNVLGAILGYGELAVQHAEADGDVRRYLDNVMLAAERAKMLVERILGFSRSGLGDQVPVNVQAVVQETLELIETSLPVGVRLDSRLEAGSAAIIGDPIYLHQVTMNLCTNALQAMSRGGVLGIAVQRAELLKAKTLTRGSLAAGSYIQITVTDTGEGIAPTLLERIFDPFFTTKGVGEGTGLGLSLVHGIVADLAGAIDVSSKVGNGTRFDIWLPAAGEAPAPIAAPSSALPRGNGETVMIVDDEQPLVALAEEIVAQLGYEPVGFATGAAALQAFLAAPDRFEAVLTDEAMPDLVGTELARQILDLRPSIPIILMSGRAVASLVNRASALGIKEVLRKPLHGREIAESLARVLESAR